MIRPTSTNRFHCNQLATWHQSNQSLHVQSPRTAVLNADSRSVNILPSRTTTTREYSEKCWSRPQTGVQNAI